VALAAAERQESIAMLPLEGKVAVMTGGTSGIGARTAEVFVANGAKVVIAGRRQDQGEKLARKLGDAASFIRTDVSVEADVKAMIGHAVGRFGRLDCLTNNPGRSCPFAAITDVDPEEFFGAFQASRSANPKQPDANIRLLAHALLFDVEYQRVGGVVSAI